MQKERDHKDKSPLEKSGGRSDRFDWVANLEEEDEGPRQREREILLPLRLGILGLLLLGLLLAWRLGPLEGSLSVETLAEWGEYLRGRPSTPFLVLGVYTVGSLLMVPLTAMVLATGLLFHPVVTLLYGLGGALAGAAACYLVGWLVGYEAVRRLAKGRLDRLNRYLAKRGIVTMAVVRNLPVAPATVVNMVAGASRIRFRDYMIGSAIGLAPGITLLALFSEWLVYVLRDPQPRDVALLAAVAAVAVTAAYVLQRFLRRRERARSAAPGETAPRS
jgi:uncharacterized membrane protein YdjX (TVP38/TMEM64 family)